jgi:DNA polymerase-3 subunit delta'
MRGILGQQRAIDTLAATLRSGRVPHALIFHGPSGVGKLTTAVAFARVLLCRAPTTQLTGDIEACGCCPSCAMIPQPGDEPAEAPPPAHPDLHVVCKELALHSEDREVRDRKLTTLPVAVLRERLLEPVQRTAVMRGAKVFILDEAELLNPEGQNLLLKTLEEPPDRTTIVLVTAQEDRLLPTIRSRCGRVAFMPLPDAIVERWINPRVGEDWTPGDRRWLVSFASGSLGRAALALSGGMHLWARDAEPAWAALAAGDYPVEWGERLADTIDAFAEQWVKEHAQASKEAANRRAASLLAAMLSQQARAKCWELAPTCDPEDPEASQRRLTPWLHAIDALLEFERLLAANVNLGLVCEHLVSRLHRGFA